MRVRVKRAIRLVLQRGIPTRIPAIIVASMGRSGSTMVFQAIRQGMARARRLHWLGGYGLSVVSEPAWTLVGQTFRSGVVYKTHALAHELPTAISVKVLFLFGPASDAALSVLSCKDRYGSDWIEQHLKHLRATGPIEELIYRDVLRFEEQIDGWLALESVPVLALNYEHIWDYEHTIREFVGFPIRLPRRRPRSGQYGLPIETTERLQKTYRRLDSKIARLPVCNRRG
jgi:hypothetical protein